MKKIAVLPTLLTLGNGICGFAAIVDLEVEPRASPTDVFNIVAAGAAGNPPRLPRP